jgi:DNA-binding Lrp family transcriptional regulator
MYSGDLMTKTKRNQALQDQIKVLNALEENSKETIKELKKKCGFSHQKIWRIIKNLETNNTIWGHTIVSDENAKNLKHFIVLVKRNKKPFNETIRKEIVNDKIDNFPPNLVKVENIYITHGMADIVITLYAADLFSAKKFLDYTAKRLKQQIEDYTLIETLFPIRKQGFKNPQIKQFVDYI